VVDRLPRSQKDAASSLWKQINGEVEKHERLGLERSGSAGGSRNRRPSSKRTEMIALQAAAAAAAVLAANDELADVREEDALLASAELTAELAIVAAAAEKCEFEVVPAQQRPTSKSHGGYWEEPPAAGSARDAVLSRRGSPPQR
jgi:hypothetical protein